MPTHSLAPISHTILSEDDATDCAPSPRERGKWRLVLIDNFDSFTYNIAHAFQALQVEVTVTTEHKIPTHATHLVLGPGPGSPSQEILSLIHHAPSHLPILGICLGHQAIGLAFGATLTKAEKPQHGKLFRLHTKPSPLFKNIPPTFQVVRYHSLIIQNIQPPLQTIATTDSGEIMALEHASRPIFGVQFHPESILSEYGSQLFKNFLEIM